MCEHLLRCKLCTATKFAWVKKDPRCDWVNVTCLLHCVATVEHCKGALSIWDLYGPSVGYCILHPPSREDVLCWNLPEQIVAYPSLVSTWRDSGAPPSSFRARTHLDSHGRIPSSSISQSLQWWLKPVSSHSISEEPVTRGYSFTWLDGSSTFLYLEVTFFFFLFST